MPAATKESEVVKLLNDPEILGAKVLNERQTAFQLFHSHHKAIIEKEGHMRSCDIKPHITKMWEAH